AEYKALMNAGVVYAKKYNLTPGVALTTRQMANLTDDIVWLESQSVTLPDGTLTTALVPKVYLPPGHARVGAGGVLVAANSMDINVRGDINNSGTIAGRTDVRLSARNLHNLKGRIEGADLSLNAGHDLDNIGGTLQAEHSLVAIAGHDLTIRTTTHKADNTSGLSHFSRADIARLG